MNCFTLLNMMVLSHNFLSIYFLLDDYESTSLPSGPDERITLRGALYSALVEIQTFCLDILAG